ncbi:MAG: hypothetical protein AAFO69_05260, partial [Bacteroidota bacterium]
MPKIIVALPVPTLISAFTPLARMIISLMPSSLISQALATTLPKTPAPVPGKTNEPLIPSIVDKSVSYA